MARPIKIACRVLSSEPRLERMVLQPLAQPKERWRIERIPDGRAYEYNAGDQVFVTVELAKRGSTP